MRNATAIALTLFCACTSDSTIAITFDPCSPLSIVPDPQSETREVEAIEEALAYWEDVLPVRAQVGEPAPAQEGELAILFEGGDTFYRALYLDKRGEIAISREALVPEDYSLAIAHELGHAFGLFHVPLDQRPSVMNVGNLEVAPTEEDAREVSDLWEACSEE